MESTLHGQVAERNDAPAESRNAAPLTQVGSEIVSVCAWCPGINILRLERQPADVILVFQQGNQLTISRNGVPLKITHGICPVCKTKQLK